MFSVKAGRKDRRIDERRDMSRKEEGKKNERNCFNVPSRFVVCCVKEGGKKMIRKTHFHSGMAWKREEVEGRKEGWKEA